MTIKAVEELVGITGKNIRFYEDCGLLAPDRAGNGYREYSEKDVAVLKKIRLLRTIGMPVEQIKKILGNGESLQDGLKARLGAISRDIDNLEDTATLTRAMIESAEDIDSLDTDLWLEKIRKMSKEGTDFVNFGKVDVHVKKKAGAIGGGIVMILLMIGIIAGCLWGNAQDPLPTWLLVLFLAMPAAVIIGVVAVIIKRMKEIDKGEEDEAAKY